MKQKSTNIKITQNADLTSFNTLALHAQARYLLELKERSQLPQVMALRDQTGLSICILGGGSNVIAPQFLAAIVVRNQLRGVEVIAETIEKIILRVDSGESWNQFVCWTVQKGYAGIENLIAIPGTVGAAPIQNIGAYGVEVKNTIIGVHFFDFVTQEIRVLSASECAFSYRESIFKNQLADCGMIVAVDFELHKNPRKVQLDYGDFARGSRTAMDTIAQVADFIVTLRAQKLPDPKHLANAGSFFKNPIVTKECCADLKKRFPQLVVFPEGSHYKLSAAWLIEQMGLKGFREGSVGIYEHHALIVVNYGGAQAVQLLNFAHRIQTKVRTQFGIELEIEPRILGATH